MKPFIRITVGDGGVVGVESNLPDTDVLIYDMDTERGDDPRSTLVADFPPEGMELPNTERLTDEERRRFDAEMDGDLDGSRTTVNVLLHIIGDVPAAALRKGMASRRCDDDLLETDLQNIGASSREPYRSPVEEAVYPLKIGFDLFADDETDPHERVITFQNSLPVSHPFPDYRGGKIRITLLPDNRIEVDPYALSEGVTVYVPAKAMPPTPPVEACWVHATGGAFLVLDDHVTDLVDYSWLHPGVINLLERMAEPFGSTLLWVDDVDDLAEDLAQLSSESGISEREILQQLLKDGRLKRRRRA